MEFMKPVISGILSNSTSMNQLFKRNLIKKYLQIIILDFIYSSQSLKNLIFYGGSCLAHCYNLPRLSEDLDFIDSKQEIDLKIMEDDIKKYFKTDTDLTVKTTIQKFRIYLKFPILREFGLSNLSETDDLFIKIEVYNDIKYCKNYKTITIPIFNYNKSILVQSFDLPTLMATKVRAILFRKWEKTDKFGKTTIFFKGRDFFDLMWFLEKKVNPNIDCIENFNTTKELYKELLSKVELIDPLSIQLDLESFVESKEYVLNLSKSIKEILIRQIKGILE